VPQATSSLLFGQVSPVVPGGCAAWNRGADYVNTAVSTQHTINKREVTMFEKPLRFFGDDGTEFNPDLIAKPSLLPVVQFFYPKQGRLTQSPIIKSVNFRC